MRTNAQYYKCLKKLQIGCFWQQITENDSKKGPIENNFPVMENENRKFYLVNFQLA